MESNIKVGSLKDKYICKSRVQIQAFTHNCLDLEPRDYQLDQKKIKVTRNLKEILVMLKPDKDQDIVLINGYAFTITVEDIFKEKNKFKMLNDDPTLINLKTEQNYLKTLSKQGEITTEEEKQMHHKFAHIDHAHRFLETHKLFTKILPFRSLLIHQTLCTINLEISWQIFYSLTQNNHSVNEYSSHII